MLLPRVRYPLNHTGLVLVDLYNDVLSDGGKLWPKIRQVADSVELVPHLRALVAAARQLGIAIFFVPHRRWREGDLDGWQFPTPAQLASDRDALFADGTWGGDWHPDLAPQAGDIVVEQHWGQDGFASTDLELQLKQRNIERLILAGVMANTCVEGTARHAVEIGYHVTLVSDATAAPGRDAMRAAHRVNGPTFAHAILETDAVIAALNRQ